MSQVSLANQLQALTGQVRSANQLQGLLIGQLRSANQLQVVLTDQVRSVNQLQERFEMFQRALWRKNTETHLEGREQVSGVMGNTCSCILFILVTSIGSICPQQGLQGEAWLLRQ